MNYRGIWRCNGIAADGGTCLEPPVGLGRRPLGKPSDSEYAVCMQHAADALRAGRVVYPLPSPQEAQPAGGRS
jgi:hypothetical protein